jgi:hypothetical protein
MTDYYIDPTVAPGGAGTFADPFDDFPTPGSGHNYWLKRGTKLTRSTLVKLTDLQNITIGAYYDKDGSAAYDSNTTLPLPKWACYTEITSTVFTETATDSNIWEYNTPGESYQNRYPIPIGIGRLGDKDNHSWEERANYTGAARTGTHDGSTDPSVLTDSGESWTTNHFVGRTITNTTKSSSGTITANTNNTITATVSGGWDNGDNYSIAECYAAGTGSTFDTFKQWNSGSNCKTLAIYSENDPYTDYGTIYWASRQDHPCLQINIATSSPDLDWNITVQDIHFMQSGTGIRVYNSDAEGSNLTITRCTFDHLDNAINCNMGTTGSIVDSYIINNDFYESGTIGIHLGGGIGTGLLVAGNKVFNTGHAASIGGIYGSVNKLVSTVDSSTPFCIIENNYVDTIFGVTQFWNYEQRCIYIENGSKNAIIRSNYCTNAHNAGIHSNAGTGPNWIYNNIVEDCGKGIEDSDAALNYTGNNYYYNNTIINPTESGFHIGRPATATDTTMNYAYNNIFIGTSNAAMNLDTYSDDLGILTSDHNIQSGFTNDMTRAGSPSGLLTSYGDNSLSEDPLLDDDFYPSSLSPCLGTGMLPYSNYDAYSRLNYGNHIGAVWPKINTSKIRRNV